jgi:hypothetical protein
MRASGSTARPETGGGGAMPARHWPASGASAESSCGELDPELLPYSPGLSPTLGGAAPSVATSSSVQRVPTPRRPAVRDGSSPNRSADSCPGPLIKLRFVRRPSERTSPSPSTSPLRPRLAQGGRRDRTGSVRGAALMRICDAKIPVSVRARRSPSASRAATPGRHLAASLPGPCTSHCEEDPCTHTGRLFLGCAAT